MIRIKTLFRDPPREIEVEFNNDAASLPLLDELENLRVQLPYGCRSGACAVCRVAVLEGEFLLKSRGVIEEDTHERVGDKKNIRLACQCEFLTGSSGTLVLQSSPELPELPPDDDET